MSKALISGSVIAAVAGSAMAIDFSAYPIYSDGQGVTLTSLSLDNADNTTAREDVGIVYDSLLFEGNVVTPTGAQHRDDYVSTISSPSTLASFQFVGGVEEDNEVVFFTYFDTSNTPVSGFGVRLPTAGFTNVWTITLTDPNATAVPAAGFLQMDADDGSNNPDGLPGIIAWRYKDVAPAIGSTTGDVYRMTMDVIPAPSSLALLGLGGLVATRRRR